MKAWKITNKTVELIKSGKYPAHKIKELTGFSVSTIRKNAKKFDVKLPKGHNARDLTGRKLDGLAVLERVWIEGKKGIYWKCLCDCGTECVKGNSVLLGFRYKSCGCKSWVKHTNKADVKGHPSARVEWHNIRGGALNRGYAFSLSFSEYLDIVTKPCIYCGFEGREIKRGNAAYPFIGNGIDRRDNKIGYTIDNSVSCCYICNRAKGNLEETEFRNWIDRIKSYGKT